MSKEIPVTIYHEMEDDSVIKSTGQLDLSTGVVSNIVYETHQTKPVSELKDYSFSYGLFQHNGKDLEFTVEAVKKGNFQIPTSEFQEMKEKAVQLLSSGSKKVKP